MSQRIKIFSQQIKYYLTQALPWVMIATLPISFKGCELFQNQESYIIEYDPVTMDFPTAKVNNYILDADYVTITIVMVPNQQTADFSCARFNGLVQNISYLMNYNNSHIQINTAGEILVNKNGCRFYPEVYEHKSTPGMYNNDSLYLANHNIKITIFELQR